MISFASILLIISTTIPFAIFGSAGSWHFGGKPKAGTKVIFLFTTAGFLSVLYGIWSHDNVDTFSALGFALQLIFLFIFGWSVGTSGKKNLSLAYEESRSSSLLTEGPYSLVRHPFYTGYIIYWIGGLAESKSLITLVLVIILIGIYIHTARSEDKVLAEKFGFEFDKWHANTGMFFPKWRKRS